MGFNGYLIKLGGGGGAILPMNFISPQSYKSTPNQRMEAEAARSITGVLHRTTVEHTATKIEFKTTVLTNRELHTLNNLLDDHFIDRLERKIEINYYDQETDSYRDAICYMPDVDYTINRIDTETNTVYYDPIRYAFIEY